MSEHYDNTDERGEDAVARQRGGSEPGHLPECLLYPHDGRTPGFCICDRLRACEARLALQYLVTDREQQEQEERAYAAALDAARDAVAALWIRETVVLDNGDIDEKHVWPLPPAALAAIDALRGER